MAGVFVQHGTESMGDEVGTTTITLDTPAPVGETFLLASTRNAWTAYSHVNVRVDPRTVIDDTYTQLEFTRTGTVFSAVIAWQVVTGSDLHVQTGVTSVTGTETTETIDAVDRDQSFITFSVSGGVNGEDATFRLMFTSDTEIRISRHEATGTRDVRWFVVEWPGVSVRHGTYTISGNDSIATVDVSPPVNQSQSFLLHNYQSTVNNSTPADNLTRGTIVAAGDTLVFRRNSTHTRAIHGSYFLVESEQVDAQHDLASSSTALATSSLDPEVEMASSFVPTHPNGNLYASSTTNRIGISVSTQRLLEGETGGYADRVQSQRMTTTASMFAAHVAVSVEDVVPPATRDVRSYFRVVVSTASASGTGIRRAVSFLRVLLLKVQRSGSGIRDANSILPPVVFNVRAKPKVIVASFVARINTAAIRTAEAFRSAASTVRRVLFHAQSIVPDLREVTSSVRAFVFNAKRGAEVSRRVASFIGAVIFKVRSWPRVQVVSFIRTIAAAVARVGTGERRVIFLMDRGISRAGGALSGVRSVISIHVRMLFDAFGSMQTVRTVGSGVRRVIFRAFIVIPDVREVRIYMRKIAATATRGASTTRQIGFFLGQILFTATTVPVIVREVTSSMRRMVLEVDVRRVKKVVVKNSCRIVLSSALRVGLGVRHLEMLVQRIELTLRGRIVGERRVRSWQRPLFFGLRIVIRGAKSVASFLRRLIFKVTPAVEPPFLEGPTHAFVEDSRTRAIIEEPEEGVMIKVHIQNTGS